MQAGETAKMLFGRCPYCRAMIYQNPKAIIYYCSRCRTPIRGKNPVMEPEDEAEYALSRLEILSADTASVFSDEPDDASYCPSTSCRFGDFFGDAAQDRRVDELRPTSRRTRRPSSSSDLPVMESEEGHEAFYMPGSAREEQRRRRSSMSSQEQGTPTSLAGPEPAPSAIASSRLMDPAFHKELLHALDNLRGLIVAVEQPRPASSARAVTRRDSRLFRRLESTLERALPSEPEETSPRRGATAGSSASSSGHAERPETLEREHSLRPILGGAPFVVCNKCSELLRAPPMPSRRRTSTTAAGTRLRCGGCEQVLTVALPAHRPGRTVSEPLPRRRSGEDMDTCSWPRSSSLI